MFIRRDRKGFNRYTWWRVGIIFFAAGLWLGGVIVDDLRITGVALLLLLVALVLGVLGRPRPE